MTVSILGTKYSVFIKKYDEDVMFRNCGLCGYCDHIRKHIVICDPSTFPSEKENPETAEYYDLCMKETLRHEIIHTFLNESGLGSSSTIMDRGWAKNEEMVDWIALQGPKIYAAWVEAKAL